jgi:hypothetical protein
MSDKNPYSNQEDEFIRANFQSMTYEEIGKALGRSKKGVSNRVQMLGLQKLKRWTPEEDQVLWDSAGMLMKDVAIRLRRSVVEVSTRWRKIGDVRWGSRLGIRKPDKDGRPVIGYVRNGKGQSRRIMEHRYIVEQALGRPLSPMDIVHHIDCDKTNNNLDNLFVCSPSEHAKIHRSIEKLLPKLIELGIVYFDNDAMAYKIAD